jgi:hypothetical protein
VNNFRKEIWQNKVERHDLEIKGGDSEHYIQDTRNRLCRYNLGQ